jgi:hypothetical protein
LACARRRRLLRGLGVLAGAGCGLSHDEGDRSLPPHRWGIGVRRDARIPGTAAQPRRTHARKLPARFDVSWSDMFCICSPSYRGHAHLWLFPICTTGITAPMHGCTANDGNVRGGSDGILRMPPLTFEPIINMADAVRQPRPFLAQTAAWLGVITADMPMQNWYRLCHRMSRRAIDSLGGVTASTLAEGPASGHCVHMLCCRSGATDDCGGGGGVGVGSGTCTTASCTRAGSWRTAPRPSTRR